MNLPRGDLGDRLVPIVLAQAIGVACGIVGVRLASSWIEPGDYGRYGIFVSLAPLGLGVVFSGLVKFVARHWSAATHRGEVLRAILHALARKTPWLLAAVAAVTAMAMPHDRLHFGALLFASAVLLTLAQIAQTALQAERAHWRDLGIASIGSVTRSFLPPLLYVGVSASLAALLAGFFLHAACVAAAGALLLRRDWKQREPAAPATLGRDYEGALFISLAIAGWIVAGFNRWLVAGLFGVENAGYFTLATNIAALPPALLSGMLLQFYQPVWFAARDNSLAARRQLARNIDRVALGYTTAAILMTIALQLAMPLLLGPVVSERYAAATQFVLATGCFMTAVATGHFYHVWLLASGRERACGPADFGGMVCLIAGGVLAASFGLEWFTRWLVVSPLVPWLVNRPLARRFVFNADRNADAA